MDRTNGYDNSKVETSPTLMLLCVPKYRKEQFLCVKVSEGNKNKAPHDHLCLTAKPVPQKVPEEAYLC